MTIPHTRSVPEVRPTPAPASDLAILSSGLTKAFGSTRAVNGIDLAVPSGSVYGILGPNGAGKTTTIRMLATLLRPDRGSATVLGHDIVHEADAVRARVSVTGQFASVDEDLTGMENLLLVARLRGFSRGMARRRARELLEAFGLAEAGERLVRLYSGGMRRRLDIAASLVVRPELLFLDEPTTGLDPRSRNHVWGIVRALVAQGATVVLTTQYLDEADRLADRVAVIADGVVIAEGTTGELKAMVGTGSLRVWLVDPTTRPDAEGRLARTLQVPVHADPEPSSLSASVTDPDRAVRALAELSASGIAVAGFSLAQPSLDEVFLALTGRRTDHLEPVEEAAR